LAIVLVAAGSVSSHAQLLGNRTEATSCASAIGGNVSTSQISVVCGIPPDVLDSLIKGRTQPLEELVAAHRKTITLLEENLDLNRGQIRTALNILGEANVSPEQIASKLVEFAERFKALRAAAASQRDDTSKVTALKSEAKGAINQGDLARADELLAAVEKSQDEVADRLAFNRAETTAQRGDIALTRLRYREAADHFAKAAARIPDKQRDPRLQYLEKEAEALYRQGSEFGDSIAATAAIKQYRSILALRPREHAPVDWAITQNNLGNALAILGTRESSTARLHEAVAAYREALKERTRDRAPLRWAMTQNNLGNALRTLGARESGTARLEEAVAAHREALKERTRERVPLQWAMTQNNLGNALGSLGARESGTARLQEAVAAFREALKERTRERVPLDWATTQHNLGTALQILAERENSIERLEEAVAASREGLKERTRERAPLDWALTQNSLGNALGGLGARESGTARLQEATEAYNLALEAFESAKAYYYISGTRDNLTRIEALIAARRSKPN
jgi:tetratricopeptide (TPR) repeat protein